MTTHDTRDGTARRGLAAPDDERSNCGVGVVLDLDGGRDHRIVADGLELLCNLEHRGTTGAEANTGDGAGVLLQRPDEFFDAVVDGDLPEQYAVGSLFLPKDDRARAELERVTESVLADHGLDVRTWRAVPTDADAADVGATARASEPHVAQCIVAPAEPVDDETFDRRLYVGRRALEKRVDADDPAGREDFYVCSLSRTTVVYKGLLTGEQLADYYPDLADDRLASTFAMVHARFSTNTLGAWHLAHPYRAIVHNGEFNTIQGNVNWMRARENDLAHPDLDDDLDAIRPVIADPDQSDTASVDNALELLLAGGRDLPHALRMLVPEAWRSDANALDESRRDWYDFHASLVEPWDGPALVCATDGERVGAVLDRNGLRPCRYDVTADDRLYMASEAGAIELEAATVVERGRLQPGELFLADPGEGRVVPDDEIFDDLTDPKYGEWVANEQLPLADLAPAHEPSARLYGEPAATEDGREATLRRRQALFGYTEDELTNLLEPMAREGKDPIGSMGDDTPLSVLSAFDRPLFSYFKQQFAQVTNPPIDYLREELVTSLETRLGNQRNLLGESPAHARQLVADSPLLTVGETTALVNLDCAGLSATVVDATYDPDETLEAGVESLREAAAAAIEAGHDVVVLSDRDAGADRLPIPSLLATGAVHHHLVRNGLRNRAGLVVDSGEPRTVHHVAALVGYGAGAVTPYLAYETIADLVAGPDGADESAALASYVEALEHGLLKVMSKMGISTVESYRGAQIFESVGLDSDFVDEYFTGTPARTQGIGIEDVEADLRDRHATAFPLASVADDDVVAGGGGADAEGGGDDDGVELEHRGEYMHMPDGIHHQWNRMTVQTLQKAVRKNDYHGYRAFAADVNEGNETLQTLRGLLEFETDERASIPVEDVEPVASIVTRFSTAAMSLGSLSPEMHEVNAVAMNRLGGKSNTGEGGEPPERFDTERECSVKQVASGRFGVTATYLASADELQIKMAQGSKPGEGGHLPGSKVNESIADVRHATPGVGLISPPPQHDIYSIEDLKQLVYDLRCVNPDAEINVKLVAEAGIGTIAAGVAKAKADVVHVSGHSGGTGASPRTSIKHAGVPWELGLAETNQLLCETGLRDRIRVAVDGGLKTGRDVAVAALLGAEEFVFGTASLVTAGCVMARQCHQNTCPVGIATQDEDRRARFPGEPEHVTNYMRFIARELREIMAELGFSTVDEMVGRVDRLSQRTDVSHPKARSLDLSGVTAPLAGSQRYKTVDQETAIDEHLDHELVDAARPAIERGESVRMHTPVSNEDRAVGALLSNRVVAAHGQEGLPDDTISVGARGTAGQSFGAFLAAGISLELEGSANDYVGKGLSGGRISVTTPSDAGYAPWENTAIGNVALYGATGGELYVNGRAGERFAVRNSGVKAVVEGVGDHGCEYMTGGIVTVLGSTGKNFAAGMSGGVAYVYDPDGEFEARCNTDMVRVRRGLGDRDERVVHRLVENHAVHTGSVRAKAVLANWETATEDFATVFPDAYREAIAERPEADVRRSVLEPSEVAGGSTGRAD